MKKLLNKLLKIKFNQTFTYVFLVFLLFGVSSCKHTNKNGIEGKIDSVTILVNTKDFGCGVDAMTPKIDFKISLRSESNVGCKINDFVSTPKNPAKYRFKLVFDSICLEKKFFKIDPKTISNQLYANDFNNNFSDYNKNERPLNLTLTMNSYIWGLSLKDTYEYYEKFLISNFKIKCYNEKNPSQVFILKKSSSFCIKFLLDGEKVNFNDESKMTKLIFVKPNPIIFNKR